jgi:hypothetical protein
LPIDRNYALGQDILLSAGISIVLYPVIGLFLAGLYLSLFRWLFLCLPAWLGIQTVQPARMDFRLPGILLVVSFISGLITVL